MADPAVIGYLVLGAATFAAAVVGAWTTLHVNNNTKTSGKNLAEHVETISWDLAVVQHAVAAHDARDMARFDQQDTAIAEIQKGMVEGRLEVARLTGATTTPPTADPATAAALVVATAELAAEKLKNGPTVEAAKIVTDKAESTAAALATPPDLHPVL